MLKYGFILIITDFSLNIKIAFIYRTNSIHDTKKIIQVDSIFLAHMWLYSNFLRLDFIYTQNELYECMTLYVVFYRLKFCS